MNVIQSPGTRISKRPVVVFSDFDGTISIRDVGYHLFHHFSGGRNEQFIPAWKSGEMSSREILTAEASLCELDEKRFRKYLEQHTLDLSLEHFLEHVKQSGGSFTVLSDGLRPYIDILLKENGYDLQVIANDAHFDGHSLTVNFPYHNEFCCYCGSCKRERIAERLPAIIDRDPDTLILFVGDGMSDRCVVDPTWPITTKSASNVKRLQRGVTRENIALMNDSKSVVELPDTMTIIPPVRVFAKKDLASFCTRTNIAYSTFETFADISLQLQKEGVW